MSQISLANEREAVSKAFMALYIQTGSKSKIDSYQKRMLRQHLYPIIDKDIIDNAAFGLKLGEAIYKQEIWIKHEWKF
jgi:hypothetical protein